MSPSGQAHRDATSGQGLEANPAIVVSAYNRPAALSRLLQSLLAARYPPGDPVPLVISVDDAPRNPATTAVALAFGWPYGPRQVICQPERLGLVRHFYTCGDLAAEYGAIVYLEDDLLVSPAFYDFARQMLAFYHDDPRIAGLSLYGLWFNGFNRLPFVPYQDSSDVFFLQVPYTQGQAFTRQQWQSFRKWQGTARVAVVEQPQSQAYPFHERWLGFGPQEWFPEFARYLAESGRFFVYPRVSLSTGMGDAGEHFTRPTGFFQAPLQQDQAAYHARSLDDSVAAYDPFFEMLPDRLDRLTGALRGYAYTLDLYGSKSRANLGPEYVLTSRPCRRALLSFGRALWPQEMNVALNVPGAEISFCRVENLLWGWRADWRLEAALQHYYWRGNLPGLRSWLKRRLAGIAF